MLDTGGGQFTFMGFLPTKPKARTEAIAKLAPLDHAWVCYEAPHRIAETLAALAAGLPPARRILIGRELTKLFEETPVMAVADAPGWLAADANRAKGEFVLVVEGAAAAQHDGAPDARAQQVLGLLLAELPAKRAAKLAAAITGASTDALYRLALAQRAARADEQGDEQAEGQAEDGAQDWGGAEGAGRTEAGQGLPAGTVQNKRSAGVAVGGHRLRDHAGVAPGGMWLSVRYGAR
jgi:16S rRNA (cytidine1402-2'-O)-methyltransferase